MLAWGLSAIVAPARPIRAMGAPAQRASLAAGDKLPAAAYGLPAGVRAPASPAAPASSAPASSAHASAAPASASAAGQAARGTATGRPGTRPVMSAPAARRSSATPPPAARPAAPPPCSAASIVVSLFTSQPSYGPGQRPQFEVYAVSTAARTCELAFGGALVRVVVTRAGQVVWDSAACPSASPAPAGPATFQPGVPQQAVLTWNRAASTPGCAGSVPTGATGPFDAVALADGRSSPVRAFSLAR
jgi:hypothetical protein